jgi:hypothetical protein
MQPEMEVEKNQPPLAHPTTHPTPVALREGHKATTWTSDYNVNVGHSIDITGTITTT